MVINEEPSPAIKLKVKKSQDIWLTKEEAKQLTATINVPRDEHIAYPFLPLLFIMQAANGDKIPIKEAAITPTQSENQVGTYSLLLYL